MKQLNYLNASSPAIPAGDCINIRTGGNDQKISLQQAVRAVTSAIENRCRNFSKKKETGNARGENY